MSRTLSSAGPEAAVTQGCTRSGVRSSRRATSATGVRRMNATYHPSAPAPRAGQLSVTPQRWNQSAKASGTSSMKGRAM